jgi:hypothetical protein
MKNLLRLGLLLSGIGLVYFSGRHTTLTIISAVFFVAIVGVIQFRELGIFLKTKHGKKG